MTDEEYQEERRFFSNLSQPPPHPPGTRIRLVEMPDDPDPIPVGTTGTIEEGSNGAQLYVAWDGPRHLHLIVGKDKYQVIDDAVVVGETAPTMLSDMPRDTSRAEEEPCAFAWGQGPAHVGEEGPFHRVTCVLAKGHDSIPHLCAEDRDGDCGPRVAPLGTPLADQWYANYDNIVTVSAWMADNGYDAKALAYAVMAPWKYRDEFLAARQALAQPGLMAEPG